MKSTCLLVKRLYRVVPPFDSVQLVRLYLQFHYGFVGDIYFRRNKVYASWKFDNASISVNRGSHFQVHFVWQVWDGQLSPAFKSIRLKAFEGWKFDRGTTKLHARILRGKGVQKKKPNTFTVGSSTSATFVLPVRHGTGVALQKRVWTFPKNFQSNRVANETPWQQWRR